MIDELDTTHDEIRIVALAIRQEFKVAEASKLGAALLVERPVSMRLDAVLFDEIREHDDDRAILLPDHLPKVGHRAWNGRLRGNEAWLEWCIAQYEAHKVGVHGVGAGVGRVGLLEYDTRMIKGKEIAITILVSILFCLRAS